ncbi:MAG: LysR family transcriptional regulator substrate-binding protein, partial [Pseudomonadota bacterium]
AQRILDEFNRGKAMLTELGGSIGGRLRIGTSHHIGLHRLPPVLSEFTETYPGVELDIHFMDSEEACVAVDRGELEVAIATLPESPFPQLETRLIWVDQLLFVVGTGHPLADQTGLGVDELAIHRAIMPARGTVTRDILDKALIPYNTRLQIKMESNYLETIKMMVSVGLGWSLLPESMCEGLHSVSVADLQLQRKLGIAWKKDRTLSNAARMFMAGCERSSASLRARNSKDANAECE